LGGQLDPWLLLCEHLGFAELSREFIYEPRSFFSEIVEILPQSLDFGAREVNLFPKLSVDLACPLLCPSLQLVGSGLGLFHDLARPCLRFGYCLVCSPLCYLQRTPHYDFGLALFVELLLQSLSAS
jgi:hypothetical protein